MKTLRKLVQGDSNATVRIDVPVSGSLRQFEVVVVWQRSSQSSRTNGELEGVAELNIERW